MGFRLIRWAYQGSFRLLRKAKNEDDTIDGFVSLLFGQAAEQAGHILGDQVRYFRGRNLISIGHKFDQIVRARGYDGSTLRHLSLAVGLPLIERASYQDDSVLQEMWANLIASLTLKETNQDFGFHVMHIEMLHQMTQLDCKILEFVCEHGIGWDVEQDSIVTKELQFPTIETEFPARATWASVDKLCALGSLQRVIDTPLKSDSENVSGLREHIVPTSVGLNLYLASSGKNPGWMKDTQMQRSIHHGR